MSKLEGSIRYPRCTIEGHSFPADTGLLYSGNGDGRLYINAAPTLEASGARQIGVIPVDIHSYIVEKDPTGGRDFVLIERMTGDKK